MNNQEKPKFQNFYMSSAKIKKVYLNKNGNEFAVLNLSAPGDIIYAHVSTKLISTCNIEKEERINEQTGKQAVFTQAEKYHRETKSAFINVGFAVDSTINVSTRNSAEEPFKNGRIDLKDLTPRLIEISKQTIEYAKNPSSPKLANKINFDENQINQSEQSLQNPKLSNFDFDLIDDSNKINDNSILWEDDKKEPEMEM